MRWVLRLGLVSVALLGPNRAVDASEPGPPSTEALKSMSLEELMELKVATVYAASKHEQKIAEAPAAVSIITDPVLQLAETARIVGEKKDYSVRAPVSRRGDELGRLTESFNEMLGRIQSQDAALSLS